MMFKKLRHYMSKQQDKETLDEQLNEAQAMSENIDQDNIETTDNQSNEHDNEAKLMQERDELRDKYLRLMAEFDNFKKRNIRERMDLMNTAARDTMTALLPVLDDFDRAQNLSPEQKNSPAFQEGIELVYHKLFSILQQRGLEPMESTGLPFDPELHSAITDIPAPSEEMKGKVVDTIERGYTLNGKIIRHAKVVTGK
jgi:molecular chaperone GrpE